MSSQTDPMSDELDNDDYRLRRLFDGYVFHIPDYQRFYSWSTQECEDLWDDLLNVIDETNRHYMGTVILKDEANPIETRGYGEGYREYAIVDGQQRFTTLTILMKAIVSAFDELERSMVDVDDEIYEDVEDAVEDARSLFVRDSSIQDDRYGAQNKLRLQREDNDVFKAILREEVVDEDISKPSEQRLVDAYGFFEDQLDDLRESRASDAAFLDDVGRLLSNIQSLEFMVYVVDSQARATLIFESVNDRGKDLSRLDKTKSFLMHKHYLIQSEEEGDVAGRDIRDRFGRIYRSMQTIEMQGRTSGISEDQVQQYHYIAKVPRSVNKTYLDEETGRRRTLQSGSPIYLDILKWHFNRLYDDVEESPHDGHPRDCLEEIDWYTRSLRRYYSRLATIAEYDDDEEIGWELSKLFALGRMGNFYPLLLTVWDEYESGNIGRDGLHEVLQMIEVASFRIYAIGNKRSDTGRSTFYRLANRVANGDAGVEDIISELENAVEQYETDFEQALRNDGAYSVFSNRDLRYLLYSYDLYVRHKNRGGAPPEIEKAVQNAGKDYSLDHVWPQDTSELNLDDGESEAHEELVDSLGNLTLTTGRRNAAWKNDSYDNKRTDDRYRDSDFASTRKLAREYESWGRSSIESRIDDLIEYAAQRWSLDSDERQEYAAIKPPS